MTPYEQITNMTPEELASLIVKKNGPQFEVNVMNDRHCTGDCVTEEDNYECPHEYDCCLRWLKGEARE